MQWFQMERATCCLQTFDKTSDERLSRIYFIPLYFVADRSFTADGGLL